MKSIFANLNRRSLIYSNKQAMRGARSLLAARAGLLRAGGSQRVSQPAPFLPLSLSLLRTLIKHSSADGVQAHTWRLRHALLLGGVGLSVLATAATARSGDSDAQCDARYAPALASGSVDPAELGGFTLPLDAERYATLERSRAKRFSCASYRANAPIEDRFDVQAAPSGDVYAAVFDGHGTEACARIRRMCFMAR